MNDECELEDAAVESLMYAKGIYQCITQETMAESLAALDIGLQELKEELIESITLYYKGKENE